MFDIQRQRANDDYSSREDRDERAPVPGKRTLVEQMYPAHVQRLASEVASGAENPSMVRAAAARGLATPSSALPHATSIQRAFGRHDISGVVAHTGGAAADSARAMNADAFAAGNHVVLGHRTDLFTVAHEVAHVVQQRGGVQLKGGVGASGDEHEQHADAVADLVVRGQSAEGLLDRYAGGPGRAAPSGDGGIQRKETSVGLVRDVGNMSRDVLLSLLTSHGIEAGAEYIERLVLGWGDLVVLDYGAQLAETITSFGLDLGIEKLMSWISPFIGALRGTLAIASKIPPSLRTLAAYGVGRTVTAVLTWCGMGAERAEEWVNKIFVGSDFTASLAYALQLLDDLLSRPVSTIYKLAWAYWLGPKVGSTAPTPSSALAGVVIAQVTGDEPPPKKPGDQSGDKGGDKLPEQVKPLLKQDLKYVWLQIDEPQLQRFTKQEKENSRASGGLVLPFNLGLDLFGVKLASAAKQQVQLPWSGGFNVELADLAITGVPSLQPVFSVGAIRVPRVSIGDKGLDALEVSLENLSFANGAATMPKVGAKWVKGGGLVFDGALRVTIFDTVIESTGKLELDGDGKFKRAELATVALKTFEVIPGVLSLANPGFAGSIDAAGTIALKVHTDIDAEGKPGALPKMQLAVKKGFVEWTGSKFQGGMDSLSLKVGSHVELSAKNARADRERITVAEASLLYRHSTERPEEGRDSLQQIGGIDPSLLSFTGLQDLVIGGTITDLRIGKRVEVGSSKIDGPKGSGKGSEPEQPKPVVDTEHFGLGSAKPVLSKIGAKLFGVGATLDVDKREGTIDGEASYKPDFPGRVQFAFPVVPGLDVFAALNADLKLGANVKAKAAAPKEKPGQFVVEGSAGVAATIGVELEAGVAVGSAWIAALTASVYGRAEATAHVTGTVKGTLVLDQEGHTLRPSTVEGERPTFNYEAGAVLKASVGVKVAATALVVYERVLYRRTLAEWTLGEYSVKGEVRSGENGKPEPQLPKAGFSGNEGKPAPPPVKNVALDNLKGELMKPQQVYNSAADRKDIIQKLALEADSPTYKQLERAALEHTGKVQQNHEWRMSKANVGKPLSKKEEEENESQRVALVKSEQALNAAKEQYRLVNLALVDPKSAADSVIEAGTFDLQKIEDDIRKAAQLAEAALGGKL